MALCGGFQTMVGGKPLPAERLLSRQTIYNPHLQNNISDVIPRTLWRLTPETNLKLLKMFSSFKCTFCSFWFYFPFCAFFLNFLFFDSKSAQSLEMSDFVLLAHLLPLTVLWIWAMTQSEVIHHSKHEQRIMFLNDPPCCALEICCVS